MTSIVVHMYHSYDRYKMVHMNYTSPDIVIDRLGAIPLVSQLTGQIKQALLRDRLGSGSALPSVRQLSNDLDLDSETVARAYGLLARDSIIRPRHSGGPVVAREGKTTVCRLAALSMALQVHETLMSPVSVTTDHVEALGRTRPLIDLGGDLVDAVDHGDTTELFLGDVSGHGIGAGIVMAMVKSAVRMGLRRGASLSELLGDLNEVLMDTTGPRMFATLACLRIDRAGRLEYALAGHHHIAHCRETTAEVRRLSRGDLPLGLFEGATYGSAVVDLEPGDLLAVYTDGLNETADHLDFELGHTAIERTLIELASRPLEAIHEAVFSLVEGHGPQADDRTLLLVRRTN